MPPRLTIAAIIAFWLAMTAWLIEREVVPMILAEDSPTYQVNLTDEISSPVINWALLSAGKRAGNGTSSIFAHDDNTYEFRSTLTFDKGLVLFTVLNQDLGLRRLESMYRVTKKGKLKAVTMKALFNNIVKNPKDDIIDPQQAFHPGEFNIDIEGQVADGDLPLRLFINGTENKAFSPGKIDTNQHGNIINPMHPVSRLRGLRHGQTWRIVRLNPLGGVAGQLVGDTLPLLIAEVKTDKLVWNGKKVVCYKIEYYPPGKHEEVVARTWVRRFDGLVLRQEANWLGVDLTMQRMPD